MHIYIYICISVYKSSTVDGRNTCERQCRWPYQYWNDSTDVEKELESSASGRVQIAGIKKLWFLGVFIGFFKPVQFSQNREWFWKRPVRTNLEFYPCSWLRGGYRSNLDWYRHRLTVWSVRLVGLNQLLKHWHTNLSLIFRWFSHLQTRLKGDCSYVDTSIILGVLRECTHILFGCSILCPIGDGMGISFFFSSFGLSRT